MWSWWDSLEAVTKFNLWMQWLTGVFTVFAAVFGILILFSGNRMGKLQAQQDDAIREQNKARESQLQERLSAAEGAARNQSEEIATAKGKQVEAERALQEMQDRLKPRHLDEKQKVTFLDTLKTYPAGQIQIGYTESDAETESFAMELHVLLREAKWDVSLGGFLRPNVGKGITIGVKDAKQPPARAVGLAKALAAAGFDSKFHSWGYADDDLIWFDIGQRP